MYVLGLYSDGDYFKVSLISKKRGKTQLEFLKEFKKDIVNLNALKKILDKQTSFFDSGVEVVSSLSSEEVFVKKINIPLVGKRKVEKALKFHLSSDDIYSEEGRYFVPMYKKKGTETEVTLYGYTKEAMDGHLQDVKTLGIDSEWVSTVSRGLERFVHFFAPNSLPFFLFHLGWERSSFYYFYNGEIKQEVSFKLGLKDIVDAVQKDQSVLEGVDMQKMQEMFIQSIEKEKKNASTSIFFELEKQISRAWTFIIETEKSAVDTSRVLFTGYSDLSRELKPFLPPIDLEEITITPHLEYTSTQISSYAIEIGLALDRIVSDSDTLQLGEGKFITSAQKKKAKKYLYRYAGLSLLSAAMIFITTDAFFIKKRALLKKRYETAVAKIQAVNPLNEDKVVYRQTDLRGNRNKLKRMVKRQNQRHKIKEGPLSFGAISDWIASCRVEGFIVQDFEYNIIQHPVKENPLQDYVVELLVKFKSPKNAAKVESFMQWALKPANGMVFETEPRIEKTDDHITVTMRVKS